MISLMIAEVMLGVASLHWPLVRWFHPVGLEATGLNVAGEPSGAGPLGENVEQQGDYPLACRMRDFGGGREASTTRLKKETPMQTGRQMV